MPSSGLPDRLRALGPWLLPAAFVAFITVLARWLNTPTVLFPELAALASVVLVNPEDPLSKVPGQLVLAPFLAAVLGQFCLWLIPWWPLTVVAAVALAVTLVRVLRTPMVPALSCGLGPWAFQSYDGSFAPSLLVGTTLMALVCLLPRAGKRPVLGWTQSHADEPTWRRWLPSYGLFLGLGIGLVALSGQRLILYPPLMVIVYEGLVRPQACLWRRRPLTTVFGCTVAAGIGTLLVAHWGVHPLATGLVVVLVEALQRLLRLRLLPAFGLGLLPFLLDEPSLVFPLCVALGTGLWALVIACDRIGSKQLPAI